MIDQKWNIVLTGLRLLLPKYRVFIGISITFFLKMKYETIDLLRKKNFYLFCLFLISLTNLIE